MHSEIMLYIICTSSKRLKAVVPQESFIPASCMDLVFNYVGLYGCDFTTREFMCPPHKAPN